MAKLDRYDNDIRAAKRVRTLGGLDEAGRGALAGPVVAAVVVLAPGVSLSGVDDSKALKAKEREALVPRILAQCAGAALGISTASEVDRYNVLQATHLAAGRALEALDAAPEFLITDYLKLRHCPCPLLAIPRADSTSLCVAAASILAKVARDRIMTLLEEEFPQYGLARHKGYGTARHMEALRRHGPSTAHRLTFGGVCWFNSEPSVHARSAVAGLLPARRPRADPLGLLRDDLPEPQPIAFLAEREFQSPR